MTAKLADALNRYWRVITVLFVGGILFATVGFQGRAIEKTEAKLGKYLEEAMVRHEKLAAFVAAQAQINPGLGKKLEEKKKKKDPLFF